MNSIESIDNEFARIHDEANTIIDNARASKRDMTADEQGKVDASFARMDQLNAQKKVALEAKFNAAQPIPNPKDLISGHTATRAPARPRQPITFDQSFSKAIGVDTTAATFGIGDYCRAMVLGARTPAEKDALQFNTDSSGGYGVPAPLSASVIDATRSNSQFVRAGALTVPLLNIQNRVMRLADNAAPAFRAEHGDVTATQTFDDGTFDLKTIAVIVRASREQLEDAINVNQAIEDAFATAFGAELDRVIGWGNGTTEPQGITSNTNIITVASAANGTALSDYSRLLDALYELNLNQTQPNGVLMSPREGRTINGFEDSTGQPLRRPDALASLGFHVSPNVPVDQTQGTATDASTLLMADFSKLYIGVLQGLRVEVLKERYADKLQYGFLAWMRVDAQLTRPKAFAKVTGIIPA